MSSHASRLAGVTAVLAMAAAGVVGIGAPAGAAAPFTVDASADSVDATVGDGVCATASGTCSLRAAVQEANATLGPDVIMLPAGTYLLTLTGSGDASAGDLDITDDLTVTGITADTTTIDASALSDRVVDVPGGDVTLTISGVTLAHGAPADDPS